MTDIPSPPPTAGPSGWAVLAAILLIGLAVCSLLLGGGCLLIGIPLLFDSGPYGGSDMLMVIAVIAGPSLLVGAGLIMLARRLLRGRPRLPS